jgi:hypothetical protein
VSKFRCWDEDGADESCSREFEAWSVAEAAELYAEREWSDCDYPETQTIVVREVQTGRLFRTSVSAVQTVDFQASTPEQIGCEP